MVCRLLDYAAHHGCDFIDRITFASVHPILLNCKQFLTKFQHLLPAVVDFNIHND